MDILVSLTAIVVVAYALFVFTAEQFLPWRRPKWNLSRRRWRYGLRLGAAALLTGLVRVGGGLADLDGRSVLLAALAAFVAVALPATVAYLRRGRRAEQASCATASPRRPASPSRRRRTALLG